MRNRLIILFLFLFTQIVWCENTKIISKYYTEKSREYYSSYYYLRIFEGNVKYEISKPHLYEGPFDKPISFGRIIVKNCFITCIDSKTNERIKFLKFDKYRLTVINKNRYFKYKETVYLTNIYASVGAIEHISWINGVKEGYWTVWSTKGVKNTLYENGVIKKIVFKTWDEIDKNVHVDSTQIMWYKP